MSGSEKNYSASEDDSKPAILKKKKRIEKPGYKIFDAEDSDNEGQVLYDDGETSYRASAKLKKHSRPSFKLVGKLKNRDKEKEKEHQEGVPKKIKSKSKKKDNPFKLSLPQSKNEKRIDNPVFGVELSVACERSPTSDGVHLPVCVRECIDYIEEHGLLYEGIYRISGVQSKVQQLKSCYNQHRPSHLYEYDPSIVASLLKQFLRELPEPVLTSQIMPQFEEASVIKTAVDRLAALRDCIHSLPVWNKDLISWMIVHMTHVIAKEAINKMSVQNVSIVLSPTMRISHRVLNALFSHADQLFSGLHIKRYVAPTSLSAASKWSIDLPDSQELIEEELRKQEKQLARLHKELSKHTSAEKEEELWEVQRNVTQLKRKLKLIAKTNAAKQLERKIRGSGHAEKTVEPARRVNSVELNFALQTPLRRQTSKSSQLEFAPLQSARASQEHLPAKRSSSLSYTSHTSKQSSEHTEPSSPQKETSESSVTESSCPSDRPLIKQIQKLKDEKTGYETPDMKHSLSQESDVTISAVPASMSESLETTGSAVDYVELENQLSEVIDEPENELGSGEREEREEQGEGEVMDIQSSELPSPVELNEETPSSPPPSPVEEVTEETQAKLAIESKDQPEEPAERKESPETQPLIQGQIQGHADTMLVPEKLHQGEFIEDNQGGEMTRSFADEEELRQLIAEEAQLIWEEEELIEISDELRKKIDTEKVEIERLHEEIAEYEELRSITTYGHSSEAYSSDERSYTSTSDTDPESETEAYAELDALVSRLHDMQAEQTALEDEKKDLLTKIHDERMHCVGTKIQIRLIQQQNLGAVYDSPLQSLI